MDKYVKITKVVSEEAKNMYSWLEWIVKTDLPITIVKNDYYIKRSNLLPMTYKAVTKYTDKLLILVKDYIKKSLSSTCDMIFDGWTCDSEHSIAIFATWTLSSGTVIKVT